MNFISSASSDHNALMAKQSLDLDPEEALGGIVCVDQPECVGHSDMLYLGSDLNSCEPEGDSTGTDQFFDVLDSDDHEIPFAVASLEPLLQPNSGDHADKYENDVAAQPVMECPTQSSIIRPEFLFATAIKPTPDSPIGLTFKKKAGGVYISRVDHCGLFHKCGFQEGDRVVAVNNVNCIEAPLRIIRDMVEGSDSTISFCVRNKYGDPHSVLTSVQKPSRESKLGICFRMKRGALTVSKVHAKGLFSNSLLMPDHRCFMINGQPCDNLGSQAAADLTAAADRVTIISRARGDLAIVLSVDEMRCWSTVAIGAGVAAAALSAFGAIS